MIEKIKNSFLLRNIIFFVIMYLCMFLSRDILFMIFVYIKYGQIYWDNVAFYEAFKATLPLYIPLVILDLIYTLVKKKSKK